jgi:hypothetical protein
MVASKGISKKLSEVIRQPRMGDPAFPQKIAQNSPLIGSPVYNGIERSPRSGKQLTDGSTLVQR